MVEGRSRLSTPGKATRTQSMRQTQSPSTNLKNTSPYQRKNLAENNSRTLSTAMSSASKVAALVTGRSNSATKENNNNARQSYAGARGKSGTGNAIDGKRKAVFCDVVLDGLPYDAEGNVISPEVYQNFISKLGTRIESAPNSGKPRNVRPATPAKPRRVDDNEVRLALIEMAKTEESYRQKITSLLEDYAIPLRNFAKSPSTEIIPAFEARNLFVNVEKLVQVSKPFAKDLDTTRLQLERSTNTLPAFGEMILRNIETMDPFREWLSKQRQTEQLLERLIGTNKSFVEFTERQKNRSRGITGNSIGLRDLLSEPFQRISRYSLMINPIIRHLADDDPNLPYLETASDLLDDICRMEEDEGVTKAAAMWGLREAIENFPHYMVSSSRSFISCLDVDEIIEGSSSSQTLRCTLFLFSDKLVIVKRPVGDKTGKELAGLDNVDNLAILYSASAAPTEAALSASVYTIPGSPKKLKKGIMGFRGDIDLTSVLAVDLGGVELGLVMSADINGVASVRWHGRKTRRFVIASTYPEDIRRAEKTVFLGMVATTKCLQKANMGFVVVKGNSINEDNGDSTRVYWAICLRKAWDDGEVKLRGPLVLHVDASGTAPELAFGAAGDPSVIARADLSADDSCSFLVRYYDRVSSKEDMETIGVDRAIPAIAEICAANKLFSFPDVSLRGQNNNLSPLAFRTGSALSRPASLIVSAAAAIDIFAPGGILNRVHSNASKGSMMTNTTTTSLFSRGSNSNSLRMLPLDLASSSSLLLRQRKETEGGKKLTRVQSAAALRPLKPEIQDEVDSETADSSYIMVDERTTRSPRHASLPPPKQPSSCAASPSHCQTEDAEESFTYNTEVLPLNLLGSISRPVSGVGGGVDRRTLLGPRAIPAYNSLNNRNTIRSVSGSSINKRPLDSDHEAHEEQGNIRPRSDAARASYLNEDRSPVKKKPLVDSSPPHTNRRRIENAGARAMGVSSPNITPRRGRISITSSPTTTRNIRAKEISGLPDLPDEAMSEVALPPIKRLRSHLDELRMTLSADIANKENARVIRVGGLSRSPGTRNFNLSNTASSPSTANNLKNLDLPTLLTWVEHADRIVKEVESSSFALHANDNLGSENQKLLAEIKALKVTNAALKKDYSELAASTSELYDTYTEELESIVSAVSAPSMPTKTKALHNTTRDALLSRNTAMKELAEYKRDRRLA